MRGREPPRPRGPAGAEGKVNDTDARLWHPWLRINRLLRAMLHEHWSAEAWPQVKGRVQEGPRAEESDSARGVRQSSTLRVATPPVPNQEGKPCRSSRG